MVLIDAAKGCATEPPDLSKYKADFVVMSFYKVISTFYVLFEFRCYKFGSFQVSNEWCFIYLFP